MELFVAGKLNGLREIKDENEFKMEVEKRFSNLKEIDNGKLYNEAFPVAKLFQKTGLIWIPAPSNKGALSTMDDEKVYPLQINLNL